MHTLYMYHHPKREFCDVSKVTQSTFVIPDLVIQVKSVHDKIMDHKCALCDVVHCITECSFVAQQLILQKNV